MNNKSKKFFIIHSLSLTNKAIELEKKLKTKAYIPGRDTDQNSKAKIILKQNLEAIKKADVVYVIWNGKSSGSLFDMGMAYALGKIIKPIYIKRNWRNYYTECVLEKKLIGD